jgi:SecD/SecF fusion protein
MTISNPNAKKRRDYRRGPKKGNIWAVVMILVVFFGSLLAIWRPWQHPQTLGVLYEDKGYKFIKLGLDLQGGLRVTFIVDREAIALAKKREATKDKNATVTSAEIEAVKATKDDLEKVKTILENRVNSLGVAEPNVQTQGTDRVVVELPGLNQADQDRALDTLGTTAVMEFRIVNEAAKAKLDKDLDIQKDLGPVLATGSAIADATPATNSSGAWVVDFKTSPEGADTFGKMTANNIGKRMAIVLDGKVTSAPTIQAALIGGGQITGSFSVEEASKLALVLKSGSLPVPVKSAEIRSIGPTLGADAIKSGAIAAVSGIGLVFVLGFAYYGFWFGLVIALGLLFSALIIVGILGGLGSTLTLPGIAGLVLTIGAAVDGNVISFERIKEELRRGKGIKGSIGSGFEHSLVTIMDVNLSHMLSAFALYNYASGPVKGFAVTLMVGVVASVFSNLVFSKWMLEVMAAKRDFSAPQWFATPKIDFIKPSGIITTLSVLLALGGATVIGIKGLNYGVDFTTGTSFTVQSSDVTTTEQIRAAVDAAKVPDLIGKDAVIQRSPNPTGVVGVNFTIKVRELQKDQISAMRSSFAKVPSSKVLQDETVGPAVGDELRSQTIKAIALGLFLILILVTFRFEIVFAVGSVIAVIHDVAIVVGLYTLIGYEFNIATVAAVLTLIGYSLNDSIIVSDRMRENLRLMKGQPFKDIVNLAINQTLSRTIMTSLATLLPLVTLFFFGGDVLKNFSLALIVGILIGTYSSIYIVAPMVVVYENWITKRRANQPAEVKKA